MGWTTISRVPGMVSPSSLSRGVMGNSDSVCSVAHAAGGVGAVEWGEKHRSVRGGREARGRGRAFSYHLVNGGKGCWRVLNHTPYRRTQPPPPGDRERRSTERKWGGSRRHDEGDKTQSKTGVRHSRQTCMYISHKEQRWLLPGLDWQVDGGNI